MIGRRIWWTLGIIAAIVLYLCTRTGASLLFLCAVVLLLLVALIFGAMSKGGVKVYLDIPAALQKNISAQCVLRLKNRLPIPIGRVDVAINVLNALTGRKEQILISTPVAPFERKEMAFAFESEHCGQFSFSVDDISVYDILGLRGIHTAFKLREKRAVPPDLFPANVKLIGGEMKSGSGESISLPVKGQDRTEIFQIREYIEGDSPKQVHWKLSQKFGRYMVTDPSLELEQALLILWDSGPLTDRTSASIPDALAEAILSLCLSLSEDSIPHSIAWKNISSGEIIIKEVSSNEDVYEVVPGVLSSGPCGGESLIPEFLHALKERSYPLIAYFSSETPKELEALSQMAKVTAFICRDTYVEQGDSGANEYATLTFTPDSYQKVLTDAEI